MPDPLTIRVRNADDHHQQLALHRLAALARAMQQDTRMPLLTAAQPAPYRTPPTPGIGTAETAAHLDTVRAAQREAEEELAYAQKRQQRDLEARARTRLDALVNRAAQLERLLAQMDTAPRPPRGCPWTYRVEVPGAAFVGGFETTYAPEVWTLDVRDVDEALWQEARAWLRDGGSAAPVRLCRERYKLRSEVTAGTRAMLEALAGYMRPLTRQTALEARQQNCA